MKHPKLTAAACACAMLGLIAIIWLAVIEGNRADSRQRYESQVASRPSDWKRGITGITFENIEGRPEFATIVVSDSSSATKIVGNIRSAFFDDEYRVEDREMLAGFRTDSSWRLRINNEHKGSIYWRIDLMDHAVSGRKLLRVRYSSNGSLRYCGLPARGPWRGWLLE